MSARPPVVVSGLPNMTPIFSRIWLMKITLVLDLETIPVSLRIAWDISRACSPIAASPISPSSSARGTSAATESTTITSTEPERISVSAISSACSPLSGWETSRLSTSTPSLPAVLGVEGVLGVDERGQSPALLGLRDDVERQRGLARGLGAVDLDDPAPRNPARRPAPRPGRSSRSG